VRSANNAWLFGGGWCPETPSSIACRPVYGSCSVIQIKPTFTGPGPTNWPPLPSEISPVPSFHIPVAASLSGLIALRPIGPCGSRTHPHGAHFLVLQLRHIDRVCFSFSTLCFFGIVRRELLKIGEGPAVRQLNAMHLLAVCSGRFKMRSA